MQISPVDQPDDVKGSDHTAKHVHHQKVDLMWKFFPFEVTAFWIEDAGIFAKPCPERVPFPALALFDQVEQVHRHIRVSNRANGEGDFVAIKPQANGYVAVLARPLVHHANAHESLAPKGSKSARNN